MQRAPTVAPTEIRALRPDVVPGSGPRYHQYADFDEITYEVDLKTRGYDSRWFIRLFVAWWFHLLPRMLPKRFVIWLFSGTSRHIGQIVQHRKGWRALHEIYNYGRSTEEAYRLPDRLKLPPEKHWWNRFMAWFWETTIVCGAGTRNRFRQVKALALQQFHSVVEERPFRILSIGSGSGQAVLEAIAEELAVHPDREFVLHALDMDRSAHHFLKALAKDFDIPSGFIETERVKIARVEEVRRAISGHEYDLIEVVGFSEYQKTQWLVDLARVLRDHLAPGGVLLFNNIGYTSERWFTDTIMQWPLDRKDPEELGKIMEAAGFHKVLIRISSEPTHTFHMAIAKKEAS